MRMEVPHALAQITVGVRLAHTLLHRVLKAAVCNADLVAVFDKEHRHAGVLTERNLLVRSDFVIFDNLAQNTLRDRRILDFERGFERAENILADIIIAVHQ